MDFVIQHRAAWCRLTLLGLGAEDRNAMPRGSQKSTAATTIAPIVNQFMRIPVLFSSVLLLGYMDAIFDSAKLTGA